MSTALYVGVMGVAAALMHLGCVGPAVILAVLAVGWAFGIFKKILRRPRRARRTPASSF